jgi:hypothetical protein
MILMVDYNKFKKNKKFVKPSDDQVEYWISKHFDYKLNGDQIRICNPDGDTKYCMAVSKKEALVHDFRPNHQQYDGTFLRFVADFKNISIREAIKEVCGNNVKRFKDDTNHEEIDEEIENEIELPSGSESLRDKKDTKLWRINMGYLVNERGLDKNVIYKSNIHYLGTEIIVPYYQYGMIVFYQSRRQMDKIFNFPKINNKKAGDFLYGFDNVEPYSDLNVVESIFNCLSIGNNTVSTGGAKLKDGQIDLIKVLRPSSITLAYDNDSAGREAVKKDFASLNKIKWLSGNIYYCLPPYSSNDDNQMDWNDMKRNKMNPSEYIFNNKIKMTMKDLFNGITGKQFT